MIENNMIKEFDPQGFTGGFQLPCYLNIFFAGFEFT